VVMALDIRRRHFSRYRYSIHVRTTAWLPIPRWTYPRNRWPHLCRPCGQIQGDSLLACSGDFDIANFSRRLTEYKLLTAKVLVCEAAQSQRCSRPELKWGGDVMFGSGVRGSKNTIYALACGIALILHGPVPATAKTRTNLWE
jgi:hypothetical protein